MIFINAHCCRKNAIDKAKSMTTHIAYPDELLDDNKLNEFYTDVSTRNTVEDLESGDNRF